MTDYAWLFGTVAIVFGIFFMFFGLKLLKFALFVVGLIATVVVFLLICYLTFMQTNYTPWCFWLLLTISVLLGVGVGILFTKMVKFAAAILAAWGGFMLGVLFNETWLYIYGLEWLFWVVTLGCAVICAVLAFLLFKHAIMLSTAFLGAYMFARGISLFVGGFPPAYLLVN